MFTLWLTARLLGQQVRIMIKFQRFFVIDVLHFSAGSKVVFAPSHRDVHHHFIYPQPPLEIPESQNEKLKEVSDSPVNILELAP